MARALIPAPWLRGAVISLAVGFFFLWLKSKTASNATVSPTQGDQASAGAADIVPSDGGNDNFIPGGGSFGGGGATGIW